MDGQTPTVDQTWSVAPSVGTVRTVGQTPTVAVMMTVSATVGTVRVAGQTPTVAQTWSASPGVGTVRTVGQQPSLAQTWSASPTAGTVRVMGQEPTVSSDANKVASPTVGTVRLIGQVPALVGGEALAEAVERPAGRKRARRRRRYVVEIDGQDFEVESLSHAQALLDRARELAQPGTPVVVTRCGGPEEVVSHGETGIVVRPRDQKAVAAAILDLLSHPETARRLGEAGKLKVQQSFSVQTYARRIGTVLEEAVQ